MSEKKYEYVRKTARLNGKKYEATGKTEAEAIMKLAEKLAAAKRGEEVVGGSMTVNQWFEKWLEMYKIPKGVREYTIYNYRVMYSKHIKPYIGKMQLKKVKDHHLQSTINRLQGKSSSLVKKVHGLLRSMFCRARQSRLIPYDPSETLEYPSSVTGHRRSLTALEREALVAVAETSRYGPLILTLLCTGMRPGEAAALRWKNVDLSAGIIHVEEARESGNANTKGPKTTAGVRKIPISNAIFPILLSMEQDPNKLVFPNGDGNMMSNTSMYYLWGKYKAEMAEYIAKKEQENGWHPVGEHDIGNLPMYCLRHTFCSDLETAGVPITIAKVLMGHSDISVTANIYTHTNDDTIKEAIQQLDSSKTASVPRLQLVM